MTPAMAASALGTTLPDVVLSAPSPEVHSLRSGLFRSASLRRSGAIASEHMEEGAVVKFDGYMKVKV